MQTLGKIFGGIGLLVLLSSPITLFFTSGSPVTTGIKALLGVALIGFYVATNYNRLLNADARRATTAEGGSRPMSQGARASFFFTTTALMAVLAVGALFAINYIAVKRNKTWDLTSKKIYSLAEQTRSTLEELKEPVTAIGFLPANHPVYDQLEQLFAKYREKSDKFTYEFKDPRKHPDLARKYQLREGQTTVVLTRGAGENSSHTMLNVISEQDLTNALIKLNAVGEQKVYFVIGHGEWATSEPVGGSPEESLTTISELKKSLLQEGYAPEDLNLIEKNNEIPKDAAALVIAGAKSPFSDGEKAALKKYLEEGGRLLYFAERDAEPGLDALLAEYGVQVDRGLLADERVNPTNPYVIVTPFFAEHEMTRLLKQLRMNLELPSVRGLSVLHEGLASGVTATPVALTSPFAWVESTPDGKPRPDQGEKQGSIPVVVASTRNTSSAAEKRFDEARVVVFGDSELLVDANWGHEANRNMVMNAIAWASNQVKKITIRPPDRDISTIDLTDELMAKIRFLSMDLLPLSLIGVGLAIWLSRRNK